MGIDLISLDELNLIDLLQHLDRWSKKGERLSFGFRVPLTVSQQISATKLNSIYSALLWGICNDADNQIIQKDEKALLTEYLKGTEWGAEVLEVGCGSGRVTVYAARVSKQLTALDRDQAIIDRIRSSSLVKNRTNIKLLCSDFLYLPAKNHYSAVLMMENLIGMYLPRRRRADMLRKVFEVLRPGGIAIISFRVVNQRTRLSFQAMPYDADLPQGGSIRIYGVVINWTVAEFIRELERSLKNYKVLKLYAGGRRPAGGAMYTAVLIKQE